jgi:hypothetical protein
VTRQEWLVVTFFGGGGTICMIALLLIVKPTPEPPKPPSPDEVKMETFKAAARELRAAVGSPRTLRDATNAIGSYSECGPAPRRTGAGPWKPQTVHVAEWNVNERGEYVYKGQPMYGRALYVFLDASCDPGATVTEVQAGE